MERVLSPLCDWVSGASECKWCNVGSSSEDCCVSVESEVPSTGSERRDGGRDRIIGCRKWRLRVVSFIVHCDLTA